MGRVRNSNACRGRRRNHLALRHAAQQLAGDHDRGGPGAEARSFARASFGLIAGFMAGSCPECGGRSGRFRAWAWRGSKRFSATPASTSSRTQTKLICGQRCPSWRGQGLPLLVHAELIGTADPAGRVTGAERAAIARYLASRPREWEHAAIRLLIELCRETGCRVHIVHLSSADALPMIAEARARGSAAFRRDLPALSLLRGRRDPGWRPAV